MRERENGHLPQIKGRLRTREKRSHKNGGNKGKSIDIAGRVVYNKFSDSCNRNNVKIEGKEDDVCRF